MFKIWAKTILGEKITRSIVYENDGKFSKKDFFGYLTAMCETLDIPTPVLLDKHIEHFSRFNITRFAAGDFVESVDFKFFVLENIPL